MPRRYPRSQFLYTRSKLFTRNKLIPLLVFIITLIGVLLSKAEIPASAQVNFTDIQTHWAKGCIEQLVQRNVITGYSDGTFRPDMPVTRAEFSVIVSRAFPKLEQVRNSTSFKDVPAGHWAYRGIQYAYQTGFLSGYTGSKFNPTEKIVRVQALGALAGGLRAKTTQPISPLINAAFVDATEIPDYAKGSIAAGIENGLVVNYPNAKKLNPSQPIRRSELAASLCRAIPDVASSIHTQYVAKADQLANTTATQPVREVVTQPTSYQPQPASRSEIRGAWITNVDSDVLFNHATMVDALKQLSELNFNTVYPTVWNWGYTLHPSEVAKQTIGFSVDPRFTGLHGRDFLAEMVTEGHKRGLAVIPWFEFGFMMTADTELKSRHPEWITQRRDGSQVWMEGIYPRVWLNPFMPEVQTFITDLVLELVRNYNIDGIQFDDHYGLPSEFGYDDFTVALYKQEHQGKAPPSNSQDPEWIRWRANKITEFTTRLFEQVKAQKRSVLFTLSPNNYRFSLNHSLQDWLTWERQGLVEELTLQVYRDNLQSFKAELTSPEVQDARRHIPTAIGILTGLKDRPVPLKQIQEQVQTVRNQNFAGVSFFFYETLWNLVTESRDETPPEWRQQRKSTFQKLFTAAAERPNLIQGWIPKS